MSIVFFGSPGLAVEVLRGLVQAGAPVCAVVTQPDKPAGRGSELRAPPVKVYAGELGLPVYQPVKVRDGSLQQWLAQWNADLAVVAAYGRILTQEVLDTPRLGCVNVHASLLPRWRGASPISRAIAAGDAQTGVCLMQMDAGLDTGDELARAVVPILDNDTTPTLEARLADAGAALLVHHLPAILAGTLPRHPQPESGMTWAPPITKNEGLLDLRLPARQVHAVARAMTPWPAAQLHIAALGETWKLSAQGLQWRDSTASAVPGSWVGTDKQLVWVRCGDGELGVSALQRPGKQMSPAADILRGVRLGGQPLVVGQVLWQPPA